MTPVPPVDRTTALDEAEVERLRVKVACWLALMYGGEEYAEQAGSNEHWREMADDLFRSVPALAAARIPAPADGVDVSR